MIRTRRRQRGSVFTMMMATVAMVGVVGVAGMNLVTGPITTASKVTHQNMAQNDLLMNAKVVVMNASARPQMGDEDGDGYVEPVPFIPTTEASCTISLPVGGQGGCLPADIGAILTDPWGTQYAYCVWDHGDPRSSTNRIDGEDSTSGAVLAIISAGPNKRFETPCAPYDGDPATNDEAIDPNGEGDDLVQIYTYAAAIAGSGGLWELKLNEPETAIIDKKLEVGDVAAGTGFAFDTATGQGEFPYVKTDFLASRSGGTTPVTMDSNIALDGRWLSGDGGNEGIFVEANGNVGIGTKEPETALHVVGGIFPNITGSYRGDGLIHSDYPLGISMYRWDDSVEYRDTWPTSRGEVVTFNSTQHRNWQLVKERAGGSGDYKGRMWHRGCHSGTCSPWMQIISESPNGNVGIGTTTPTSKLHVVGDFIRLSGIDDADLELDVPSSAASSPEIRFMVDSADIANIRADHHDRSLNVSERMTAGANTRIYLKGGNVGIRNSNPSQLLHIGDANEGGGDQTLVQIGEGAGSLFLTHNAPHISSNSRYDDGRWRYEADGPAATIKLSAGNGTAGIIEFSNAPAGSAGSTFVFSERMRIAEDGNVGIGISNPAARLDVSSGGDNTFMVTSNGNTLRIGTDSNLLNFIRIRPSSGDGIAITNNGDTAGIFVKSDNAFVGVGTTLPSHRLHVSGVARSAQANFATSSDARVKEDIEPLSDGLATLMRLRPVSFHYKSTYAKGKQGMDGLKRGFIAQEVESVVPEMVTQAAEDIGDGETINDFRILNNADFTPILVKAVQELKAENDSLRAANDNFRRELDELKAVIGD